MPIADDTTTRSVAKVPGFLRRGSRWSGFKQRCSDLASKHLNFYRIHVIFFIVTPLVFSGIFYASNSNPIKYIDCLYVCSSAMTVTGLTTINISTITAFQQAILFFLMCIGNLSTVSITMVWIRRHFFRNKFDAIVRTSAKARERAEEVDKEEKAKRRMILKKLGFVRSLTGNGTGRTGGGSRRRSSEHEMNDTESRSRNSTSSSRQETDSASLKGHQQNQNQPQHQVSKEQQKKKMGRKKGPLRADMIRRMDGPAVLINPTGERSHVMPTPSERLVEEGFATLHGRGERNVIPERNQDGEENDPGGEKAEVTLEDSDWQDEEEGTTTAAAFARAERRARAIAQAEAFDRANNYSPGQNQDQQNQTSNTGGILNNSNNNSSSEEYPSSPTFAPNQYHNSSQSQPHHHGGFSSQPPSIRISLPRGNGPPSAAGAFMLDSTIAESPGQISTFQNTSRNNSGEENKDDGIGRGGSLDVGTTRSFGKFESKTAEPSKTRFSDLDTNYFVGSGVGITQNTHDRIGRPRRDSDPQGSSRGHMRRTSDSGPLNSRGGFGGSGGNYFPRTHTVEFAEPSRESRQTERANTTALPGVGTNNGGMRHRNMTSGPTGGTGFERTFTGRSMTSGRRVGTGIPLARTQTSSKQRGFGGFPTPLEIASTALKTAFPRVQTALTRSITMNRTSTIASIQSGGGGSQYNLDGGIKTAPYLSFDLTVSGNSRFHELTEAQRDELGGVEYRAIDLLAKLIPAYLITVTFTCIVIVAPILKSKLFNPYEPVFASQGPNRPDTTWFWFFQVVSAYTNTGMSLIDTSMIQMQSAYYMLIPMGFLILAGNTAFPIVLRFFIWCFSSLVPKTSRIYETLRFLLDHPRRCFVYLFPARQTWFLVGVLCVLNATDWIAFLVLDIGNDAIEDIPTGTRVLDGLFQSIAVRAAGFQTVSLLNLAPAVQMLYVVMMYISVYPIAMSVRSTNVYEERTLGIWEDYKPPDLNEEEEQLFKSQQTSPRMWGSYLAAHATKQLSFDIWFLAFSLWVICIIERSNIQDPTSNGWFTIFSCLFELTSAYGTVGLSLGTPYDNFSLSGRFSTLSKLVVIIVMLRGRHRGLPIAIDRAVLLPDEIAVEDQDVGPDWTIVDNTNQDNLSNFGANTNHSFRTSTNPKLNPLSPKQSFGAGLANRSSNRRDSSGGSNTESSPNFFLDPNQPLTGEPQNLEAIHESNTPPMLSREGSQKRNERSNLSLSVIGDEKKDLDQGSEKLGSEKLGNSSTSDVEVSKNETDGIHQLVSGQGNPSTSSEHDSGESSTSAHPQTQKSQDVKGEEIRSSSPTSEEVKECALKYGSEPSPSKVD